jgi:hypothetical protein
MKNRLLALSFCFLFGTLQAQVTRVDNTHSFKATFIGVSYAYEQWLTQQSAVNLELMIAGGFGSNIIRGDYWIIAPVIRLEPRNYYNFVKRHDRGRNTLHNAANYVSFSIDYQPGISIGNNNHALRAVSLIPKWGLRRGFGKHLICEFATGIGAYHSEVENWQPIWGIDLKLGMAFKKSTKH